VCVCVCEKEKMTSTWEIIAEHFGFMLVWGDFVFIPFYFSLQTWYQSSVFVTNLLGNHTVYLQRYLVGNSPVLSTNYTALCVICFITGMVAFFNSMEATISHYSNYSS